MSNFGRFKLDRFDFLIMLVVVGIILAVSYGLSWVDTQIPSQIVTSNPPESQDILSDPVSGEDFQVTQPSWNLYGAGYVPSEDEPVEPTEHFLIQVDDYGEDVVSLFIEDGELQVEGNLSEGAKLFFDYLRPYVDDHIARGGERE